MVKPLQSVAMGLVFVIVTARLLGGVDFIPDPIGWLLVLFGVRRLGPDFPHRTTLLVLAALAGVISVALFVPHVAQAVVDADPALWWGVSIPQLLFCVLIAWQLAGRAAAADDEKAARWLRMAAGLGVLSLVLPPIVFGGQVGAMQQPVYALAALGLVLLTVLLFAYSSRPWVVAGDLAPRK